MTPKQTEYHNQRHQIAIIMDRDEWRTRIDGMAKSRKESRDQEMLANLAKNKARNERHKQKQIQRAQARALGGQQKSLT